MSALPPCPNCDSEYTYEDGALLICPECAHEWSADTTTATDAPVIKDSNGNPLADGDTVTVIKDLKIKGSSSVVKRGTKVKNICLVDGIREEGLTPICPLPASRHSAFAGNIGSPARHPWPP